MYDFSNDSHLLSSISQGYVGWAGNVLIRDSSSIPELVATQPEEDTGMQRKTSLQDTDRHKVRLAARPVTAKARLETVSAIRENIRVVIGDRPMSSCPPPADAKVSWTMDIKLQLDYTNLSEYSQETFSWQT